MYKVIGGDRKEYGPVSADDVRRWIAEGRLNVHSQLQAEGTTEWKPLASFPEFAEALRSHTGATPAAGALATPAAPWSSAEVLAQTPRVEIGRCLSRSWDLCTANLGLLLGATFLIWIIGVLGQFVPFGGLVVWLFHGVFTGGLCMVFLKSIRGQQTSVGEAFSGFNIAFGQLLLAGVVRYLLTALSFCLCILPCIYLAVAWIFGIPLVADKRLEFWTGLELSRKIVTRIWFEILGLIILAYLPMILTSLIVQTKISLTVMHAIQDMTSGGGQPDFSRIFHMAYDIAKTTLPLAMLAKVVLLLNIPFALGALMYAYEDIFGARPGRTP
jgi:hypothetical protein